MSALLRPNQGLLYMKVGVHAQEPLDQIIARKLKEIDDAGFALWGYGGNTCHPTSMVQPFAAAHSALGQKIYLCMKEMNSQHFADQIAATDYSVNGVDWAPIPSGIRVLGSRYALAIRDLRKEEFDLPLSHSRVAIGNSKGASGAAYIAGRVDKACLELSDVAGTPPAPDDKVEHISLVAELCEPYAVFLRTKP